MTLIASALVVAMAVPAFAAYTPCLDYTYSATKYEGQRVQVTTTSTKMTYSPHPDSGKIMDLSYNEALVDSGFRQLWVQPSSYSRLYIGGKQGSGMVEGFVRDDQTKVASTANGVSAKARVALTAWSTPTGSTTAGADIPAGATLNTADGTFYAYADGARVKISGYTLNGTFVSRPCYVNTNWATGSTSSYYVQFYQ